MTSPSLSWDQVLAWRMQRSGLVEPFDDVVATAHRLVGVQAQVMPSAETAIVSRTAGVTPAAVRRALWESKELVKTWTVRGTLHLVTRPDLAYFVAAMTARGEYWAKPSWEKYHGVTAKQMSAILDGLDEALGADCLTREQLGAQLGAVSGEPEIAEKIMGSWGSAIKPAAFRGKLIFGPNAGRNVTFISPRTWIGGFEAVDEDAALGSLARRYFDTYGPGTRDDLTRWLGVETKVGRRAFNLALPDLTEVVIDGVPAWCSAEAADAIRRSRPRGTVRMLPAFDPYVVGVLSHLGALLPEESLRPLVSRKAGWISPTIVRDGRIVGVWEKTKPGRRFDISVNLFVPATKVLTAAIEREKAALAALLSQTGEEVEASAT